MWKFSLLFNPVYVLLYNNKIYLLLMIFPGIVTSMFN
jgi:hypothetical protein